MKTILYLVNRNRKLFFKDKGMLFSALITPLILLVLYTTFLANVYHDSFVQSLPKELVVDEKLINGCVGGQLFSALLAVSCVTVACCVNLNMIQDKITGARRDLLIAPIKGYTLGIGYFLSTLVNTLIICYVATGACFLYIANVGWYYTIGDVGRILWDVFLLVLFGTSISSVLCYPLSTQGQLSAVGTIISAGYGFICGAYMPISNFGEGLQKTLSFLPTTYATSLIKNHALRGVFDEMKNQNFPDEMVSGIRSSLDCSPKFSGEVVSPTQMMVVVISTIVVLIGIYILLNVLGERKKKVY